MAPRFATCTKGLLIIEGGIFTSCFLILLSIIEGGVFAPWFVYCNCMECSLNPSNLWKKNSRSWLRPPKRPNSSCQISFPPAVNLGRAWDSNSEVSALQLPPKLGHGAQRCMKAITGSWTLSHQPRYCCHLQCNWNGWFPDMTSTESSNGEGSCFCSTVTGLLGRTALGAKKMTSTEWRMHSSQKEDYGSARISFLLHTGGIATTYLVSAVVCHPSEVGRILAEVERHCSERETATPFCANALLWSWESFQAVHLLTSARLLRSARILLLSRPQSFPGHNVFEF